MEVLLVTTEIPRRGPSVVHGEFYVFPSFICIALLVIHLHLLKIWLIIGGMMHIAAEAEPGDGMWVMHEKDDTI